MILVFFIISLIQPGCKKTAIYPPENWNVVWIVVDALNVHHLGCYGYSRSTTKSIDGLAKQGVRFEYCITQAPWTLPSFASMLSSRYPYEVVMTREYLRHIKGETEVARSRDIYRMPEFNFHWYCPSRKEVKLISQFLKQNGFDTFAFTNNQWLSKEISGLDRGFDVYNYTNKPDKFYAQADEVLLKTSKWIEQKKLARWFAFVHLMEPHSPHKEHSEIDFGEKPIDRYDSSIAYMDKELGKFFSRLKELGLWEKTVVVINADHGEAIAEGERTYGHGGLMTMDVVRVPLIIYYPGCERGKVIKEVVRNLDIVPTLIDLLKLKQEESFKGKSLVPLLKGKEEVRLGPAVSMAVFLGPEQISILVDGCKALFIPAYGDFSSRDILEPQKSCGNEKEVRAVLGSFMADIEQSLSIVSEQPTIKISPEAKKKLEALGYFK